MNYPKVSIEKAMEMSLDEYITECGIYAPPKKHFDNTCETDLMNEDKEFTNNYESKNHTEKSFDLRDKFRNMSLLSENNNDSNVNVKLSSSNTTTKVSSLQQRLVHTRLGLQNKSLPNISMTDLLKEISNNGNHVYRYDRNNKRNQKQNRKNYCNNYQRNNDKMINLSNNGKIQRFHHNRNNFFTIPKQNSVFKDATTIECTIPDTKNVEIREINNYKNCNAIKNNMVNTTTALQTANFTSNELKPELMPLIAEKLLGFLTQNNQNDKPKYDLNLQKEIHSIQGKQMTYKCPGGEIISSDGPGVDCKLIPSATGISLNQRFA